MTDKAHFSIKERPETDVYVTDNGFIGIRQRLRGEETLILLTVEETDKIIGFLRASAKQVLRDREHASANAASPAPGKGLR
ncbi:MAG: hypothetical protein LUG50_01165 [Planctomycetaceae bacterium]|nr:hypothetical protein [Planctomycetaceae bacterium]